MRTRKVSFFNYMLDRIEFFRSIGKIPRTEKYKAAFNKLWDFMEGKDLAFEDMTTDRMIQFSAWCERQGNCPNTISYYNRILRAIYNMAVEDEITEDRKPFRKSFCGNEKTVKRAIPTSKVKQICHLDLSGKPKLEYARDIFMLSFYLRGMSFVDMATLKKTDVQKGVVVYRRSKTGQKLYIKIEKPMKELFEKYWNDTSVYLLDIIRREGKERADIKAATFRVNKALHEIGRIVGVDNLTTYVARHSWASACRASNIPISVISEGMGHDSEETTRIYLAQLDTSVVDKANRKIISQVI